MTNLFKFGQFKLAAGGVSNWKIECDALTTEDWEAIAVMAAELLQNFGDVIGVPRGGTPFAAAMEKHATSGPRLVVDDVYTTGKSILGLMGENDIGCVLFARGLPPKRIVPVFIHSAAILRPNSQDQR